MNRNQLLLLCLAIILVVAGLMLFVEPHAINNIMISTNLVSTSTRTTSAVSNQIPTPSTSTVLSTPSIPRTNTYAINLPNTLMLVDGQGRRTGRDPITDTSYHEIPGTSYFEEGASGQLHFSTPPPGQYTLYILGGQTGQYHLDVWVDGGGPTPAVPQRISGDIQRGSMVVYSQNYDPTNIPSSTVAFQGHASSTASITSAPPNNLPPPPVP